MLGAGFVVRTRLLIVRSVLPGRRRLVSSSSSPEEIAAAVATATDTTTTAAAATSTNAVASLRRHGPGDGVLTLNVGGTEFVTLRSTVQQNAVLWEHVQRAEANQEFTQSSKTPSKNAVFIDRHPAHFGLILQHLRNRSDNLSYRGIKKTAASGLLEETASAAAAAVGLKRSKPTLSQQVQVQLPKDSTQLRDLYVESVFYDIPELTYALCHASLAINVASVFSSGSGNPFDQVARAVSMARTTLVATTGVTGLGTLWLTLQRDVDYVLGLVGLSRHGVDGDDSNDDGGAGGGTDENNNNNKVNSNSNELSISADDLATA